MSQSSRDPSRAEVPSGTRGEQEAAERRRRVLIVGGVLAALVGVLAVVFVTQQALDPTGKEPEHVPSVASAPTSTAGDAASTTPGELDGYSIFVGEPDAPTTVTVYEDLQCPACASFESELGDDLAEAVDEGSVRMDYRLVSFLDGASTNDYSSRALNAALVVLDKAGVDAFRAFHDDLYADQPAEGGPGFEDDELIERAVEAGAAEEDVRDDIEDKVYEQWIINATGQMSDDGVNSTPWIRIDGEDAEAAELAELLAQ